MCIGNNFSNMFCSLMIYLIINRCILKVFLKKLLIFIPIYESILIYATKKSLIYNQGLKRADDGNRTRDLRLTKATLYRLSQGSAHMFYATLIIYNIRHLLSMPNRVFLFFSIPVFHNFSFSRIFCVFALILCKALSTVFGLLSKSLAIVR